ncbi:MAG: DUF87 domain-containing protein [candidate division Zixibacteria bacterium]|nr:DUF87 domain-containing protein [candidate division Zixibacteria bacterium]
MSNLPEYKGRIIGRSISEIFIRSHPDANLVMGEILTAGDSNILYFLRVVDILYGFEAGNPSWALNLAGAMMEMESAERGFQLFDKEQRNFEVGKCVILGFTRDGEFKRAKSLPPLFSQASVPTIEQFSFIKKYAGDITVGKLRSGDEVLDFRVGMGKNFIPSHTGIFATTGMGKSNLMKCLASSVMESDGVGMLIFDPHGEYIDGGEEKKKGLVNHPCSYSKLTVFSHRNLSHTHSKLRLNHREINIEDLILLFDFSQAQLEAAYALYNRYGADWLKQLDELSIDEITEEISSSKFHETTISVLQRRAKQIFSQKTFHKDEKVSVTKKIIKELKLGNVVLIDLSGLSGWRELLPAAAIARQILDSYHNEFRNPGSFKTLPNVTIVLEEAQRVLGQLTGTKENIFSRICREGRKFKVGLTAITQQPKLIDEEILSQFNTLFILGLADERDRNILRSLARQDIRELTREIQMLQPGEALISSPQTPFAIPAIIDLYEEYISTQNADNIKSKNEIPSPDEGFF